MGHSFLKEALYLKEKYLTFNNSLKASKELNLIKF